MKEKLRKIIQISVFSLCFIALLFSACKKDRTLSGVVPTNSGVTVEEAQVWLKENKPDLNLGSNWDNPILLTSENGNKVLKIRLNETLYEKKTWVMRDVIFQKDSTGKIEAFGYKVFVDNAYFSNKNGANEPLADKRSFINGTDFTGKVVIYTLDNHAIKGWKYLNGQIESDLIIEINRGSNQNPVAIKPRQKSDCGGKGLTDEGSCSDGGGDSPTPFDGGDNGHPLKEVPITAPAPMPGWTPSNNPTGPIPIGNPNPGPKAGGGGGESSSGDIIVAFKDYPCAKDLGSKLPKLKNSIAELLKSTFSQNDEINITFEPRPTLRGNTTDGELVSASGSNYVIGINPDVLKNSTKEYILVTLYHEGLHAYFAEKKRVLGPNEFNKQFLGMDVNNGRLLAVQNQAHWPMGYDKYIRGLKDAILSLNPNFGEDRAIALAEAGIIILDQNSSNINNQERDTRNSGYKGTKCP